MGRPAKYDTDTLLNAAAAIAAAEGPAAVTMVAVIKRAGVPSGSLYHRFPSRAALLGELWLRTVRHFQAGWLEALGGDDPRKGLVAAARHVVRWSRRHREEARLLLYGANEFAQPEWPDATRGAVREQQRDAEAALRNGRCRARRRAGDDRPRGARGGRHPLCGRAPPAERRRAVVATLRGSRGGARAP
jgi:AcrR family transcriptional regulator